jgi:hypothetical protein
VPIEEEEGIKNIFRIDQENWNILVENDLYFKKLSLTPSFMKLTSVLQIFGTYSFPVLCKGNAQFRRRHWAKTRKNGRIDMVLVSISF